MQHHVVVVGVPFVDDVGVPFVDDARSSLRAQRGGERREGAGNGKGK